ncbi:MAG: hypothetical protein IJI07_11880 [Flexilinea sp.]|nr:hypothetical protein [Flexilinea sp.]
MKKYILFIAVMLLALSAVTGASLAASVYDDPSVEDDYPVTVDPLTRTITHEMTLTTSDTLDYTITYEFSVGDPQILKPETTTYTTSDFVEGKPTIASVTYSPADNTCTVEGCDSFAGDRTVVKEVSVDWTGVKFKEPGFYYWQINKTVDKHGAPQDPSNDGANGNLYLVAFVIDDGTGNLVLQNIVLSRDMNVSKETKKELEDSYPAQTFRLSVKKTVTGNQGSKDQYFEFLIKITPGGGAYRGYTISGFDPQATVRESPYNRNVSNQPVPDTTVYMDGGVENEIPVWLKDNQTFTIDNLPYNTQYTVEEVSVYAEGYTTTYKVSGDVDPTGTTGNGLVVTDSALTNTTTIEFINNRDTEIPTGINLETGAPVMGLIMTAVLLRFVFVPKRKKENQE